MDGKFEKDGNDPFTKFDDEVKSFHLLNERKANFTRFLKMSEKNRGSVKPHIFEKVTADYKARLDEIMREWVPLVQGILRKLQGFNDEKSKLEREITEASDSLDELLFRILVGEFEEEQVRDKKTAGTELIEDLRLRLNVLQRKIDYYKDLKSEISPDDMPADLPDTDRESKRIVNLGFPEGTRPVHLPERFSGGEPPKVDPVFDLESPLPEESTESTVERRTAGDSGDAFEILDEGFDEQRLPVLEMKLDR